MKTGQAGEAARSEKTEKPVQETAGNSESAEQNRMTDKTKFERDVQMEHHAKSVRMTNADVADEPWVVPVYDVESGTALHAARICDT